jgi:hypothetical protein
LWPLVPRCRPGLAEKLAETLTSAGRSMQLFRNDSYLTGSEPHDDGNVPD